MFFSSRLNRELNGINAWEMQLDRELNLFMYFPDLLEYRDLIRMCSNKSSLKWLFVERSVEET